MKIPQHTLEAILFGIAAILCTGCASTNPLFNEWDWNTGFTNSPEEEKAFTDKLQKRWDEHVEKKRAFDAHLEKTWPSLSRAYDEPGDEQHVEFRQNTGKRAGSARINR